MSSRQDVDHLNLLAIFHYVLAAVTILFSVLPMLYAGVGIMILAGGGGPGAGPIGWFFLLVFGGATLLLWLQAGLAIFAGVCLHRRRARTFCFIVAAINCTQMPHGTILGVFTILVLCRESVQELFAGGGFRDPEDDDDGPPPPHREYDRLGPDDTSRDERDDWRREGQGYYGRDDHDH
jgi:hypothetical protein